MRNKYKAQQVKSNPRRWLLEILFPDKKFDGQFQNPGTEKIFDFDDVMAIENPIAFISQEIAYYPEGDDGELFALFISGLGQPEEISSKRSRRYAQTLRTGVANMNNSSFLKQNPIFSFLNKYLDWIDAAIHRIGLAGSPAIRNTAVLILYAIENDKTLNLSGDSHGTILLARAINHAKRKFIAKDAAFWNFKARKIQETRWQNRTDQLINVFAFGNSYKNWVKGPKYIMVSIKGDIVPEKFGMNRDIANQKGRDDIKFIVFERVFEKGNFEAHNMMFTNELLRQTFIKNDITIGNFAGLYYQLKTSTLELATAAEVNWPDDMKDYVWNEESLQQL
ncbi:hypothetical protein Riv7116_4283 [Rivularia sp. PCC 7116]|uniref:hypothetical protein n=1 Tax=Rivularia sp. PCC 7116 TaxID=373994 RepID=UPI00029F1D89|nr:hypothetical protein [Rivularia sp. PCC 7116]AFY56712.1 hypothetical protein Riv7116_4283 [Rivularia sp. PCC 7116]